MKNITLKFLLAMIFLLSVSGAQAYPTHVEQDITILCGKYTSIKQFADSTQKVACSQIREGYMYVYSALQKPLFSDLAGVYDQFKKNKFQDIMKKDISSCNRVNPHQYDCSIGDMRMIFSLNSKDQVLQSVVKINAQSNTFKKMLGSGNRPNQQKETSEYKDLVYDSIAKASAKVDGRYIRTEYYNGELILTFLNKDFN